MNHKAKRLFALLLAVLLTASLRAAVPVKGCIVDSSGEPLPGVMVYEKDAASNGTMTDENGNFSLSVASSNSTLIISCIGFRERREPVGARSVFNFALEDETSALDEAIVVGYGVQKKGSLTSSVASVSQRTLQAAPTDNVTNLLGGKLPGLVSRQTSGLPGENESSFYIRGISTTGSSAPLVLVDGVERDFANLDPSEIADITILKDAASAAVYGVKGANGVVLVTTRRGDVSKATVSYNGAVSLSTNANMIELLDGPEYAYWHNKATDLDGVSREYSDAEIGYIQNGGDPQGVFGNTDWLSLIFKKVAVGHNHNLTVSGGNKNVRYFVGASFLGQNGIIDNVSFKRYNLRSNVDINIVEGLTLKLDISGRIEKRHQPGVSAGASDPTASLDNGGKEYGYKNIVFYAISARPTLNPRLPDGTYLGYQNPLIARDESGFNNKNNSYIQTAATLQYDFRNVKGLKLKAMASYDFQNVLQKLMMTPCEQLTPQYGSSDGNGGVVLTGGNSPHLTTGVNTLTQTHTLFSRYTFQAQASYNRTFSDLHEVGADIVWEQSGTKGETFSAGKQKFAITEIPDFNFGSEITPNSVTGYHSQSGRQGLLIRGSYGYDSRYLLQASVRMDWSAKFAKGHRLGVFPAVSAGWRISEEKFMQSSRHIVDNLKIRASYGMLGNDAIADFLYVRGIGLTSKPNVVIGGVATNSLYTTSVPNTDITWETTSTYNGGVDLSLWNGMLSFTGDVFYKSTTNILQSQSDQMPPSIGGNYSSILNRGKVDVKGFEAVLGHSNKLGDFSYDISANISFARNRYTSTNDSENIPSYQRKVGTSLGSVLGYVSDGLYQSEEDLIYSPKTSDAVRLGDIKYKDLNGDGKITAEDRTWIARSPMPEIMYGLNIGLAYKGIELTVFFQGAANTDIMLCGTYSALGFSDGTYYTQSFKWGSNPPKYLVEGSWRPDNTGGEYPRLSSASSTNNSLPSDFWKRDASYLRLKNLALSYTLPVKVTRKFYVEGLKVYFSANNVATISKLSRLGIDPEAPSVNNGYYPQQRVFNIGVNLTF